MSDKNSNKDKLLGKALEVFSQLGYEGASTREIAKRAGLNHALVTHYFGSKEKLWKTVVSDLIDEFDQSFLLTMAMVRTLDLRQQLQMIARNIVLFSAKRPELHRIVVYETAKESERLCWVRDEVLGPRVGMMIASLESTGIDMDEAKTLMTVLIGAATHIFATSRLWGEILGYDLHSQEGIDRHFLMIEEIFGPKIDSLREQAEKKSSE
jgi:AcrR family transcriptional regulator